jgi:pyruvate dehydrogenase E1 component
VADHVDDPDPQETREWLDSLAAVVQNDGPDRARWLLDALLGAASIEGIGATWSGGTPYVNTIPPELEPEIPGDQSLERRLRSLVRWNAMATVLQANKESSELGGHIASYQSAATLYEVGFNHFWRARTEDHGGDLLYIQGHSSPGIYARAFLEGRIDEEQLRGYRQDVDGRGLS